MRGVSGPERDGRDRHLDWEGCFNARDLGGLPTVKGFARRWGAVVRADSLDALSAAGWESLWDYGVRTVIDLRNDDELGDDAAPRPPGLMTIHLPLDGIEHHDFWSVWRDGPQFGTPLYYGPHLERFPERSAAVLSEIAHAAPGEFCSIVAEVAIAPGRSRCCCSRWSACRLVRSPRTTPSAATG